MISFVRQHCLSEIATMHVKLWISYWK